jgi:hypothetical protein
VLPRSVYASQQFDFFALPSDHASQANMGNFKLPLRRLEMRSEVQVRQGAASGDSVRTPTPLSEPHSFDQPIKSAMQTILDNEVPPGSPRLAPPGSFPNGVAGKQGRWRDAIPIRAVAPTVNAGIGSVRQGLGRVRASAMVPRRRASSGAYADGATYSSSISFEDDTVFADHIIADSESASTACTSEHDSGDDAWGLNGLDEEDEVATDGAGDGGDYAIHDIPFEDEFELMFDTSPSPQKATVAMSSRLPVPVLDRDDNSCSTLNASPQQESHLLESAIPGLPSSASSVSRKKKKGAARTGTGMC